MKIEYYVEFAERSSHTGREVAWYREKFEGEIEKYIKSWLCVHRLRLVPVG